MVDNEKNKKTSESEQNDDQVEAILLSDFLSHDKITITKFKAALKTSKVNKFNKEDVESSLQALSDYNSLKRFWLLLKSPNSPKLPEGVEKSLEILFCRYLEGRSFYDKTDSAADTIRKAVRRLSNDLEDKNSKKHKEAEILLRLIITWLMKTKTVDPYNVANSLSNLFDYQQKTVIKSVQNAIISGGEKDFQLSVSGLLYASEEVNSARADLHSERRKSDSLRQMITNLEKDLELKNSQIDRLSGDIEDMGKTHEKLKEKTKNERILFEHEKSKMETEVRVLLTDQIQPLLMDAVDALEIDTPHVPIALSRIKKAMKKIGDGQ